MSEHSSKLLAHLELSQRTYNALRNGGCATVGDVLARTEAELLRLENFGRRSLNELKEALSAFGLRISGSKVRVSFMMDPDLYAALCRSAGAPHRIDAEIIDRLKRSLEGTLDIEARLARLEAAVFAKGA